MDDTRATPRATHIHFFVDKGGHEQGEGVLHVEVNGNAGASVPYWATPDLPVLAPQLAAYLRTVADYLEQMAFESPAAEHEQPTSTPAAA